MHELSLSQGMLDIIEQQAATSGFESVRVVHLEIGALSCVERQALEFCFESVTRGSIADGAGLEIVALTRRGEACERCNGYLLKIEDGERVRIVELEVT